MSERRQEIARLRRERPRSPFLRTSAAFVGVLALTAWASGGFFSGETWSARRAGNLKRFLGEIVPWPLQGQPWDWSTAAHWAHGLWTDHYHAAARATLAISIMAIILAAVMAAATALLAARNVTRPDPFLPSPRTVRPATRRATGAVVWTVRAVYIWLRAIPEYVWAFLLLALYGPRAWPLVLALALHNTGILGKLTADVVENLEQPTLAALRGLGASRAQIALAGIFPLAVNRVLLYVFYRWETCVREATVLGMLGMVSLGYWIQDARARNRYDEMVLGIIIGAVMVVVGDLVSAGARWFVRRA